MDQALGWIGAMVEWFGQFVPRWTLVKTNYKAIKYLPGDRTKLIEPGICWYWPVTTEIYTHPVCRQVRDTTAQTLMTKDRKSVYVSGIVIYTIDDLHTFYVDNYDAEDNLDDVLQTSIRKAIVSKDFDEIQAGRAKMDNALTREAQAAMRSFGVCVEVARLTDFSLARTINLVGPGIVTMNLASNT